MGVLIRGIEMPPSCDFCPMTNDGFYLCKANNPYRELEDDFDERRPDWCPLVPIPPHGRLIDADALESNGWYLMRVNIKDGKYETGHLMIAPTIIPADPEEDE